MTRSIVIAGVSKAIGRAEAEALVAAGWDVIGIARHAPGEFSGSIRDY
jgi:NAD(P)-dependent dehydrogenase (short-subunit alcohol dehydrogenase family)